MTTADDIVRKLRLSDGEELARAACEDCVEMCVGDGLLFVAAGDIVHALDLQSLEARFSIGGFAEAADCAVCRGEVYVAAHALARNGVRRALPPRRGSSVPPSKQQRGSRGGTPPI